MELLAEGAGETIGEFLGDAFGCGWCGDSASQASMRSNVSPGNQLMVSFVPGSVRLASV